MPSTSLHWRLKRAFISTKSNVSRHPYRKQSNCHAANCVVTGDPTDYPFDNLWCHQWRLNCEAEIYSRMINWSQLDSDGKFLLLQLLATRSPQIWHSCHVMGKILLRQFSLLIEIKAKRIVHRIWILMLNCLRIGSVCGCNGWCYMPQLPLFLSVEVLLAVAFLGLCASLPGGMILDRFGARWASLLALIISTAGYLMVWSATLEPEYYRDNFYLLVMYFLVAGRCRAFELPGAPLTFNMAPGNIIGNIDGYVGNVSITCARTHLHI